MSPPSAPLQPIALDPDRPEQALAFRDALAAALDGSGPALLPLPSRIAAAAAAAPGSLPREAPEGTALVIETSGSTGAPKRVALAAEALLAAARATEAELGRGRWLLALPAHYIAGAQLLVRGIVAGSAPAVLAPGAEPAAFVAAVAGLGSGPVHTALVPVQLQRLLDGGPAAVAALRRFDSVLLGGQSAPPALLERAASAGVRLVRSYGATETAGGIVYDARPIEGTRLRLRGGLLEISAPSLAIGYLDARGRLDEERSEAAFITEPTGRWFRSRDLAELGRDADGGVRLAVLGRGDDVLVSGGVKLALGEVQSLLESLAGFETAVAVAIDDPEWGQAVGIALDGSAGRPELDLRALQAALVERLGPAATPRRVIALRQGIPRTEAGKPDRRSIARAFLEPPAG